MSKTVGIVGGIVLLLVSLCFVGYGGMMIIGSFDPVQGNPNWITPGIAMLVVGLLLIGGGIVLLWLGLRKPAAGAAGEGVTLKIDLPGGVSMDTLKCKSCGGVLKSENIKMVAGAPVVTCPYCDTTYQLTEEPKW